MFALLSGQMIILALTLLYLIMSSHAFSGADCRKRRRASSCQPAMRKSARNSLSHTIPPLDGVVGAPQLPVLTTKDARVIERWLEENVAAFRNKTAVSIVGFDQESIAKPPWKPERASLPDGPATVQLATPTSCLIIQLSLCGDGSSRHSPEALREVINNDRIIKVGVGIDDDALELYRWSKESVKDEVGASSQYLQLFELKSRFDLGCLLPHKNASSRAGIKELGQKVLGVKLNKSKRVSMSNWGHRYLTEEQIAYAARDAWVSAAIIERLQKSNEKVFGTESLMQMDFMKNQTKMKEMDERMKKKKILKDELKFLRSKTNFTKIDAERKEELCGFIASLKGDQPPTFSEDAFNLLSFYL